jgi:hypothetical protein
MASKDSLYVSFVIIALQNESVNDKRVSRNDRACR